ncbi:hypothetical protein [Rhizomonospora bruguierae]|uniref:hypothetical protein n=1 Tax=Rhizomonospora bruguierae TaxID=1581705 RepID=UPI001BCFA6DB|nr:hypothetical protein [Micromonospora sp. NBRC 107566]
MRWSVGAAVGIALLALVTGCGTELTPPGAATPPVAGAPGAGGDGEASPTRSPISVNTAEALEVANKEFDLLAQQDWVGAWKLWSTDAQKEVPQKEFVKANTTCPVSPGAGFQLQKVVPISEVLVELAWRREGSGRVGRGSLRLVDGKWYFQPDGQTLAEYSSGAAKAISNRRENGTCGK